MIHEHSISQNNLFNEPLVLTAVFKIGHGKWVMEIWKIVHSGLNLNVRPRSLSHASLPSSFKNKEEIMNSKKDVICANEKKKRSSDQILRER